MTPGKHKGYALVVYQKQSLKKLRMRMKNTTEVNSLNLMELSRRIEVRYPFYEGDILAFLERKKKGCSICFDPDLDICNTCDIFEYCLHYRSGCF